MTVPGLGNLNITDIALLLALAGFCFYGLFFGLIKTIGSLAGVLAGAWLASRWYALVFGWLKPLAFGYDNLGLIISFIVCFVVINRLVGLAFVLLDKAFHLLTIIPFLKTINRLAGLVFGLVEGGLVLGLLLFVIVRYVPEGWGMAADLKASRLAGFFLNFAQAILPLLPAGLKQLPGLR